MQDRQPVQRAREREIRRLRLVAEHAMLEPVKRQHAADLGDSVTPIKYWKDVIALPVALDPRRHLRMVSVGDQSGDDAEIAPHVRGP